MVAQRLKNQHFLNIFPSLCTLKTTPLFKKISKNSPWGKQCHTLFEMTIQQNKWTWSATWTGLLSSCLGFIFYILENRTTSRFGGLVVHRPKNLANWAEWAVYASWHFQIGWLFYFPIYRGMKPVLVLNKPRGRWQCGMSFYWSVTSNKVWCGFSKLHFFLIVAHCASQATWLGGNIASTRSKSVYLWPLANVTYDYDSIFLNTIHTP